MEHFNFFLAFELLGFAAFAAILARELYRRDWRRVFEILSCAAFGLILEISNIYLGHTYYYGEQFLLRVVNVPLVIGFGWAVIFYCAMLLSDQYNIPWKLRPFVDALTVVVLDFSMDVVAIRLGLWQWVIPFDQEWYGVPFENFIGWILVALSFSSLIRFLRLLDRRRWQAKLLMILSPILAYAGLLVGLSLFRLFTVLPYQINNWPTWSFQPDPAILYHPQVQLWKLIFLTVLMVQLVNLVVWALIRYRRNYLRNFDLLSFVILSGMHLFFLAAIFLTDIWRELPVAIAISLAAFSIHLIMHLLPYLLHPKLIYFFGKVRQSVERTINDSSR